MNEDRIDERLKHERLGHESNGIGSLYSHITDRMRAELIEALTTRWESAINARLTLAPRSPVALLDELLAARAA